MSFRILNQAPQYLLPDGRVNAGGKLRFFETDLSTPKLTWGNEALTVPNANPVVMDAAGRTSTDVWGDGEYGVVMTDADDVVIWTRNNVRAEAGAGSSIPALLNGQFLTNDGSILAWQPIRQVPDPTGSSGYLLSTDGVNDFWAPPPSAPPAPDIEVTSTRLVVGDGTNRMQFLRGTGTTSSGIGTKRAQGTVTYSHPFSTAVVPMITPTGGPFAPGMYGGGYFGDISVTAFDANGFTFIVDTNHGESNSDGNISGPVTIGYLAMGPIA